MEKAKREIIKGVKANENRIEKGNKTGGKHFETAEMCFNAASKYLENDSPDPSLKTAYISHSEWFKFKTTVSLESYTNRINQFDEALKIAPNDAPLHCKKGIIHFALCVSYEKEITSNHLQLAREHLEQSIRLDPNYYATYFFLSRVYQNLGKTNDASVILKEFVEHLDQVDLGIFLYDQTLIDGFKKAHSK